jgi:mannose-1-phosphate guanylyltransferase
VTPWAVVLAGGEGTRLRPLIRRVLGDERPKQYVPLLGPQSLLRQTLDRVALRMPVSRTVVVTVRAHTGYIAQEFTGGAEPPYVLVQPSDRGTAAGILHAAHWIRRRDPEATIAFFPSDHFILGEATFMAHVADVVRAVEGQGDRVALVGAQPTSPETDYGWMQPGAAIDGSDGMLRTVREFCEKPSEARVQLGLATGCLWNTAIMVARAETLIALGALALPEMHARLDRVGAFADSDEEPAALHQAYALMSPTSFGRAVLERHAERLAVSALPRVTWCDLGSPSRVLAVLARMRVRPAWAEAPAWSEVPAGSPARSDIIDQPAIRA